MSIKPSLSKLFLLPVFIILFSLGFFSFKSEAAVVDTTPFVVGWKTTSGNFDAEVISTNISNDNLCFFFTYQDSNGDITPTVVCHNKVNFTVTFSDIYSSRSSNFYTNQFFTFTYQGETYYYCPFSSFLLNSYVNYSGLRLNTSILHTSLSTAFADWEASQGPDYADFGLQGFEYAISVNHNTMITNDIYQLNYYISWGGSTNPEFPLSEVKYELYGFNSISASNYDKSNGILVDSGTCSSPFNYDVYSKVKNWNNQTDFEKFIIYLIPFSGRTEGNTSFIVCNCYKSGENLNFGFLEIPTEGLFGLEATYGSGVINVTPSDVIDNVGVDYIDGVPIMNIIANYTGSFNRTFNIYKEEINYNPVIYDTTNNINNYYDQSNHITNTDNSTTIINNFNGNVNFDNASADGIISFLTALVTFFNTFWSYIIVCLNWLPSWVTVFITTIFTTTASIIVILGIFKLVR